MDSKSAERLRAFALAVKRHDAEAWRTVNEAAAEVRKAVERLASLAGLEVAADYLATTAATLREARKLEKRRNGPRLPTVTGRLPHDPFGDAALKAMLRRPPTGANGRPLSIAALARWQKVLNPRWVNTETESVRRHLTRLAKEARAEALRPLELPPSGSHPNRLLALAGFNAPAPGTNPAPVSEPD